MQKGQRNEYEVKTGQRPKKRKRELLAWGLSQPSHPRAKKGKRKRKQTRKVGILAKIIIITKINCQFSFPNELNTKV